MNRRTVTVFFQAACTLGLLSGCFSPTAPSEQSTPTGAKSTAPCITPDEAERMADQVLQLVNLERAQVDLSPVVVSPTLTKIAEGYACRLVEGEFFGHEDPKTGHGALERAVAAKYMFYAIGENLAAGPETPADVMKAWMDSPSHRDVVLDPSWREIGIAVRTGGKYSIYWVQEFGDPAGF